MTELPMSVDDLNRSDTTKFSIGDHEYDQKLTLGPKASRSCTDWWCTIPFLLLLAGFISCCIVGIKKGDVNRLVSGRDFDGNICGYGKVKDYPVMMLSLNFEKIVEEKPDMEPGDLKNLTMLLDNVKEVFNPICVNFDSWNGDNSSCPNIKQIDDWTVASVKSIVGKQNPGGLYRDFYYKSLPFPALPTQICNYKSERCVLMTTDYLSVIGRFCIPDPMSKGKSISQKYVSGVKRYWNSIWKTWPLIAGAAGISFAVSLIYLFSLQCLGPIVLWTCIPLAILVCGTLGGVLIYFARATNLPIDLDAKLLYVLSGVFFGVTLVLLILVILCFNALRRGTNIISVACMFVTRAPTVWIFTLITTGLKLGLISSYIYGLASIISVEEWPSRNVGILFGFTILCFFVIIRYLDGFENFIVAGSVVWWYFIPSRFGPRMAMFAPFRVLGNFIRYHHGSVALGSFCLAVIAIIKIPFFLVKLTLKGIPLCVSFLPECIIGCVGCAIECIEKVLSYLASTSYIYTNLKGKGFLRSAASAWKAIMSNPALIGATACITIIFKLIGMVIACGVNLVVCWFLLKRFYITDVPSIIVPLIVSGVVAAATSFVPLNLFSFSARTVVFCYIEDSKTSGGSYTPGPLKGFVESSNSGCCK